MTMVDFELVDVVCIGSGGAGLAAAIAAADAGQSVFVAEPRRWPSHTGPPADTWAAVIKRHWGVEECDELTADYLHELTDDLGPPRRSHSDGELPVGSVESFDRASFDPRQPVAPFYGHELADWARDCLGSTYGLVFSRLTPLSMSELRTQDGTTIRANVIAEVPSVRRSGMTLRQWLRDLAAERGVTIYDSSIVQRLIFNDGEPVGAALETVDGVRHLWARKAVLMGTSNSTADDLLARCPASALSDGRLSLVSRNGSRFARLELLTSAQNAGACTLPLHPRSHDDLSGTLVG